MVAYFHLFSVFLIHLLHTNVLLLDWTVYLYRYDVKSSKGERDAIKTQKRYVFLLIWPSFGWGWNRGN